MHTKYQNKCPFLERYFTVKIPSDKPNLPRAHSQQCLNGIRMLEAMEKFNHFNKTLKCDFRSKTGRAAQLGMQSLSVLICPQLLRDVSGMWSQRGPARFRAELLRMRSS